MCGIFFGSEKVVVVDDDVGVIVVVVELSSGCVVELLCNKKLKNKFCNFF